MSSFVPEHPLYEPRPIRVISVGAGLGGIHLAKAIKERCRKVDHQVYERLGGVGGTWSFNRYPGVGCDVPSHGYTLSWAPWSEWSRFVSPGEDCLRYAEYAAGKSGILDVARFNTSVIWAKWDEKAGKWKVELRDDLTGTTFHDEAEVFINATGAFSHPKMPSIPGLDRFKGLQGHTARWNIDADELKGKRVAVVGAGSSGAQVTSALPEMGIASCDVYIKSKSWLSPEFASNVIAKFHGKDESEILFSPTLEGTNPVYTEELKECFRRNPDKLLKHRAAILQSLNSVFAQGYGEKDSQFQTKARPMMEAWLKERMAKKPELWDLFIPEFSIGCRRPVAGSAYIHSLCSDVVRVVRKSVREADETGLVDEDGAHRVYDVIVWATGYRSTWKPPFEVVGRKEARFDEAYEKDPRSFLIAHASNMPNYFSTTGPFTASLNGDFLGGVEKVIDSIVKFVCRLQQMGYKSVCVKDEAVDDFVAYADEYLKRAVQTENCSAWYKQGSTDGPLRSIWPGSTVHSIGAIGGLDRDPPWEYFDWQPIRSGPARFGWLGNGHIPGDQEEGADLTFYLNRKEPSNTYGI